MNSEREINMLHDLLGVVLCSITTFTVIQDDTVILFCGFEREVFFYIIAFGGKWFMSIAR